MASTIGIPPTEATAPGEGEAGQESGVITDTNEPIIEADEV